jgi:hypothetical protein
MARSASIRSPLRARPPTATRPRRVRPTATGRDRKSGAFATGVDLSAPLPARERPRRSRAVWLACAAGGIGAALVLVQLRTESIGLRYQLARALQTEQQLLEQQRQLTVELRRLRHPVRLTELGRSLGLERPEHVIELGSDGRTDAAR